MKQESADNSVEDIDESGDEKYMKKASTHQNDDNIVTKESQKQELVDVTSLRERLYSLCDSLESLRICPRLEFLYNDINCYLRYKEGEEVRFYVCKEQILQKRGS